jgi:thioredoxin 1
VHEQESDERKSLKNPAITKIIIVIIVAFAVLGVFLLKRSTQNISSPPSLTTSVQNEKKNLPRVVDLGRGKCIPCKMMAPILEELKKEYEGRAIISVVDIGVYPAEARKYRIRVIPTQIFINSEGEEVFRHEGFMSKKDIIKKLHEMGVKDS